MAYDPRVVAAFNKAIAHTNAPPVVAKALFEAGIVESGLRNLNYGDRDSVGALQQRPSQGWAHALQPYAAALDFLAKAIPLAKSGLSSGDIAQAVQRSAYPGRYAKQAGAASALVGGRTSGSSSTSAPVPEPTVTGASGPMTTTVGTPSDPGQAGDFTSLVSSLLSRSQPQTAPAMSALPAPSFAAGPTLPQSYTPLPSMGAPAAPAQDRVQTALGLVSSLGGVDPTIGSTGTVGSPQTGSNGVSGASAPAPAPPGTPKGTPKLATFDGKQVAGWIAPALEYARAHGWKGTVSSGYRTYAQQKAIYDSGVRPAAKPGTSNHEGAQFPAGAVDVTNAQQLSSILARSPYRQQLIWAGAKDPVHFSHPHNGGY